MNECLSFLTPPAGEEEEEKEAVLGAPKQTEGLCIVLSVSAPHPQRRQPGSGHTRPQFLRAADLHPADQRPKPPQIAPPPGAAGLFAATVSKDEPAPPPHPRSVALRKKTWNDAFLRLIKAQPHSPGFTGLLGRPRGRLDPFNPQNHPSFTDAPCSHARVWLQVPGEAEAALPVSALQQGDAGAGPSVYLWTSVLWHLSARIPQVRGVFVCSHEAGDTRAGFGRATVNNGCVGVSSPFPQPPCAPILLWWPPTTRDRHAGLLSSSFIQKNVMKDTTDMSRWHLSVACHCSAGGGGNVLFLQRLHHLLVRKAVCNHANAANVNPRH